MAHFVGYKSTAGGTNLTVTESSFYALVTSLVTNEGVFGTGMIVEATSPVSGQVRVNDGYIIVDSGAGFKYLAWSRNTLGYELVNINPNNDPTNSRRDLVCYQIDTTAILSGGGGGKFVVVQGTASASPVDPDLTSIHNGTDKYAIPIARITLPPSTVNINSGMIGQTGNTDNATIEPIRPLTYIESGLIEGNRFLEDTGDTMLGTLLFGSAGRLVFPNKTQSQINALTPNVGEVVFNTSASSLDIYLASGWTSAIDPLSDVTSKVAASNIFT